MMRHALKFGLLFLAGAIITIAVAWACTPPDPWLGVLIYNDQDQAAAARGWPCPVPSTWPPPNSAAAHRSLGWRHFQAAHFKVDPISGKRVGSSSQCAWVEQAGWPFAALRSTRLPEPYGGRSLPGFRTLRFVSLGRGLVYEHYIRGSGPTAIFVSAWLPLQPTPGFLADTVLYAAALLLLIRLFIYGRFLLRRTLRLRRNLCPHCGYSLRGLPPNSPCPECGNQLSSPPASPSTSSSARS